MKITAKKDCKKKSKKPRKRCSGKKTGRKPNRPPKPARDPDRATARAPFRGSVDVPLSNGYAYRVDYSLAFGEPFQTIHDDAPGFASVFLPISGHLTLTNTTPGREWSPGDERFALDGLRNGNEASKDNYLCPQASEGSGSCRITYWQSSTHGSDFARLPPGGSDTVTIDRTLRFSNVPEVLVGSYMTRWPEPEFFVLRRWSRALDIRTTQAICEGWLGFGYGSLLAATPGVAPQTMDYPSLLCAGYQPVDDGEEDDDWDDE